MASQYRVETGYKLCAIQQEKKSLLPTLLEEVQEELEPATRQCCCPMAVILVPQI
jgi:hypothetical protein